MIQFHQVKKTYKDNDFVLGDLNFHVEKGEFVFLIGPSGSGKTTVIRLLIREEQPSNGKIFIDDNDITRFSRNKVYKLRRQIGVIFQDYKLIPDKNVYENVAFAMEVAGKSNKEIQSTVPYLLEIVGLSARAKAFPEQLSGGEKQRVSIARAVSNNPRVLIADEPTGNLDPGSAWDIVQILSKINNWGTTVIMSTHGTDIVNTLNKRVIQMEGGQIVRDDSKGRYEFTGNIHVPADSKVEIEIPEEVNVTRTKRGPIRVNLKHSTAAVPAKKKSGILGFLFKSKEPQNSDIPVEESIVPQPVANIEEKVATAEKVDEDMAEQVLEDADRTPISELNLRPEVVADLKVAGYEDVEDLLSDGPDELAKKLIIDPEEVVQISKALTEFLAIEEEELEKLEADTKVENKDEKEAPAEREKQPEPKKEEEEPKKEDSTHKTKLSLTAKKSK